MLRKTLLASTLAAALSQAAFAQQDAAQPADTTAVNQAQNDTPTKSEAAAMEASAEINASASADMAALQDYHVRASDLLGVDIENAQDEELGELDDLIITGGDKVMHAVISVGGFLGVGDKRIAVPYDELEITRDADDNEIDVVYNATKEELENKPAFTYRDGDLSWRERMQTRMGEWTEKAKGAVKNITQDDAATATKTN